MSPAMATSGPPPSMGPGGPGERGAPAAPWVPKTELGRKVLAGEITSMADALHSGLPLKEVQIADALLPNLHDEVLDVNMVQRMTDSGRRFKFAVTVVVGNGDGFVGLGRARGREVGPTIRRAIDHAKLNLIEVYRGCGSWECGCYQPHTLPYEVRGRVGSVRVTFKPAPRGVGLAVGDVAKPVLRFAGMVDCWGYTAGHTKTTVNYAQAAFEALRQLSMLKVPEADRQRLKIIQGATGKSILPPKEALPPGGPGGRGPGGRGPGRGGPGRGGPGGRGRPGRPSSGGHRTPRVTTEATST
jgi:small subunit ribosomal protein S5